MVRARSRPFPAVSAGPGAPAPGSASAGEPAGPSVPLEALTRWGFPGASARGPHGQGRLVVWHRRAVRVGASLSRPAGLGSVREGWLWAKGRESEWLSVCAWVCGSVRTQELRDVCGSSPAGSRFDRGRRETWLNGRSGARRARSCQQRSSSWLQQRGDNSRVPPEMGGESRFQTSDFWGWAWDGGGEKPPGTQVSELPGGLDTWA